MPREPTASRPLRNGSEDNRHLTPPHQIPCPHLTVGYVPPPYDSAVTPLERSGQGLPRGSVLLLDLHDPEELSLDELTRVVRDQRTTPSLPVALRLADAGSLRTLYLVSSARTIGISAVLLRSHALREALWQHLPAVPDLADEWLGWVRLRHPLPGHVVDLLGEVVRKAPASCDVADLCCRIGVSARTVTYQLRKSGLPRLERWYLGTRLLHAELALLRDPTLEIDHVSAKLGYSDPLSYSNQAYRLFGVTPAASRKLLGLEWRFLAWWNRSRP